MSTNGNKSNVFGEQIWVVVSVIPNPNQIQMGWGEIKNVHTSHYSITPSDDANDANDTTDEVMDF
jgi:hypothetical protein